MSPRIAIMLVLAVGLAWPRAASATFQPPTLVGQFVDTSNTIRESAKSSIDSRLAAFRRKTGAAIVVYITGSLQGESIEDAAYTTFNAWKIGDAGKDNGVLLMIAPVERKVRIETGKGIGGAVTDLQSNDIIAKMAPAMQKYDLGAAIDLACTELEKLILHEVAPLLDAEKAKRKPGRSLLWLYITLGVVGALGVLMIVSRKARDVLWPILKALGVVFYGIAKLFELFGGGKGGGKSGSYRGGGGSSGGGGSTGSY